MLSSVCESERFIICGVSLSIMYVSNFSSALLPDESLALILNVTFVPVVSLSSGKLTVVEQLFLVLSVISLSVV